MPDVEVTIPIDSGIWYSDPLREGLYLELDHTYVYGCSEVSIYLFAGEMPTISYYKPIASSHLIMPRRRYTVAVNYKPIASLLISPLMQSECSLSCIIHNSTIKIQTAYVDSN